MRLSAAQGNLVSQPGIELKSPAFEVHNFNQWTAREVLILHKDKLKLSNILEIEPFGH